MPRRPHPMGRISPTDSRNGLSRRTAQNENSQTSHSPRALIDSLESRRMLATDFYLSFDFTHSAAQTAAGYITDAGKKYSTQSKQTFGWNIDNTDNTRNRRTDEILRYDTIAFMGIDKSATKWELALQTGLYEIGIVAGDAKYADGHYVVKAEGTTVVNHNPTKAAKFGKGYSQVWVTDGKLTISSGGGAENNKLVSVTVRKLQNTTANGNGNGTSSNSGGSTSSGGSSSSGSTGSGNSAGSGSSNSGSASAGIVNKNAVAGIVNNEMPVAQAIPIMKALGMKSVRIWYGINSWTAGVDNGDIQKAAAYKAAGISVTMAFVSKKVGDAATVKSFFQKLASRSDLRNAVDYWEIGNEMNLGAYWNSSLKSYVTNYLKPAYEAIHPFSSEKVVGGAVSWDVNAAKELVKHGYNNYCDYAGFHPYGESGAIVAERTKNAKAAFNNKPLIVSEWNVQFVSDQNKWAKEITIAAKALSQYTHLSYYYALKVDGSHVGKGGAVYSNGTKNPTFYNALKSWTT